MPTNFIGVLLSNSPNYTVNIGFSTQLYDAPGSQTIIVQSGASLSLFGAMGGNTIQLTGNASSWQVLRDGSTGIFIHTDGSRIEIPAITEAQNIIFDDFQTSLVINTSGNTPTVVLGDQVLGVSSSPIDTTVDQPGGGGTDPEQPPEPSGEQTPWTLVMETRDDSNVDSKSGGSQKSLFISDGTTSGTEESPLDYFGSSLSFATTPDDTAVYFYSDYFNYLGYTDSTVISPVNLAADDLSSYYVHVNNEQILLAGENSVIVSDGTLAGTTNHITDFAIPGGVSSHDADNQNIWFPVPTAPYGSEMILFDYSPGSDYSTVTVKDIWPGSNSAINDIHFYSSSTFLPDGRLVFSANDGVHGSEPWVSDGSEEGTFMLGDMNDGAAHSYPGQFTAYKNSVVFVARIIKDGGLDYQGYNLVFTDGSTIGTYVMDATPNYAHSNPTILGQAGELLYFTATDVDGVGLFSTDGVDFIKLASINSDAQLLTWSNNIAYFRVSEPATGHELWAADLTGALPADDAFYLVKDILPGSGSGLASYPNVLQVGNAIAFNAYTSATNQRFFVSDGTEAGTLQLATSLPSVREIIGDVLIFATNDMVAAFDTATDQTAATELITGFSLTLMQTDADQAFLLLDNNELHVSDGTTVGTAKLAGSVEQFKVVAEDALFFVQNSDISGKSLWYSDGTTAGTRFIEELPDNLYYDMDNAVGIRTFITSDEDPPVFLSGNTAPAIDENSGAGQIIYTAQTSDVNAVTYSLKEDAGDIAYLSINSKTGAVKLLIDPDYETQSSYSFTVVATDRAGNLSEQQVALTINDIADEAPPVFISPDTALAIDESTGAGQLVYTAEATDDNLITFSLAKGGDKEAFQIDAVTGEVTLLANPDYAMQSSYSFTVVATDSFGNASQQTLLLDVNQYEGEQTPWTLVMETRVDSLSNSQKSLFVSDGTTSGTEESTLDGVVGYWPSSSVTFVTTPDDTAAYFYSPAHNYLGYTDGTVSSPVNLAADGFFANFVNITNEQILLAGQNTVIVSDGTLAGTTSHTTDFAMPGGESVHDVDNQNIWFPVPTAPYGSELILFDYSPGSDYSTVTVKDIWPGSNSGTQFWHWEDPAALLPDGRLVFSANDGVHGNEPWVSDGTESGTFMLADFHFGSGSSSPNQFTQYGDTVALQSHIWNETFGVFGSELAFTDGTTEGTYVLDINPGYGSSDPNILGQVGDLLYFTANDGVSQGIFSTDGTDFIKLAEINSEAELLSWSDNIAYFRVSEPATGHELWAADLTGTLAAEDTFYLVKDILPGSGSSLPQSYEMNYHSVGDQLFFNAYISATAQALFRSDGSEEGTIKLVDGTPSRVEVLDDTVILVVNGGIYGVDTASNTISATELITSFSIGENHNNQWHDPYSSLQTDIDQAFFRLNNGDLYATDATLVGTVKLAGSVDQFKVVAEDALFFVQNSDISGKSLWYSDGTTAGTRFIEELPDDFYYNMDNAVGIRTVGFSDNSSDFGDSGA